MKRFLIISLGIVALLVAAVFTLPFLVPSSVYKAQVEKAATEALGREVTLLGEARLSVFPTISAKIGGAQVANPDGFEGTYFIEAGELKGSVKLWPLLTRSVEIDQITLSDATIRLERLEDGRTNWEFGDASSAPEGEDTGGGSGGGLSGGIASARLINTAVFYNDRQAGQQYALTEFTADAKMASSDKPFTSAGEGRINGQAFEYDVTLATLDLLTTAEPTEFDVDLVTDYGRVRYDGRVTLDEAPYLNGAFDINSETLGALIGFFDEDLPIDASAIESLRTSGQVTGPIDALGLTFSNLDFNASGLDVDFEGSVSLGEVPTIDGALTLKGDGAHRLFKPDLDFVPLLAALGVVNLTADISGALAEPSFSNIKLEQRSDLLSADYQGDFSMGIGAISGSVSAESEDLHALLALGGVDLGERDTLKSFSFSGTTTGTLSNLALSDAALSLDQTSATGTLAADMRGARPRLTADLDMPVLDLTPLLGSSADASDTEPTLSEDWNDDPLALNGLNAVDATVDITAGRVVMDQIELEDAVLRTRLDEGRLSAIFRQDEERPGFRAFDGNWSGDVVVDASRSTPSLNIEAIADSIAAQKLLGDLTGFKSLSGIGDVHLDLSSNGNSLKALINDLDGNFETDLSNGVLQGVNLAKLVRDAASIQELYASGNLSVASFREALSPEAETDFSNMVGALSFTNGVAQVTDLRLDNPVVMVTGSGQIDLGARTIDISLVPSVDISAQRQGSSLSLDDMPIPIRVSGNWSNISFSLDTGAIQAELVSRARGQVADEISDRIGGELGGIVGDIVGQRSSNSEDEAEDNDAEQPSLEDELTNAAIGAIFGNRNAQEEAPDEEQPAE